MPPRPTIGSLADQVYPWSSLMAMIPNEYPSEYSGIRIRPDGNSSGCVRVNHPMREKYLSPARSISFAARAARGPDPAASFPNTSFVRASIFFGISRILS